MSLARAFSCAVVGLEGSLVEVEVDVARAGLASMTIVCTQSDRVARSKSPSR